ncbi:hypothetical protein [Dongia sp.]|uniref:hypothetical protein n=1 Tax=Dongia sp. TaxID=1977262 RepID=UPI0035B4599B
MASIRVRTTKDGRSKFEARIRKQGWSPVAQTFDTLKEAKAWAAEVELAMNQGSWITKKA